MNPARAAWALALLLLASRAAHLGPELDEPHQWRQMDTAHYVRDFALRGYDLLHPRVCWMGAHRTLALEFPLPEALAAGWLRALGLPHDVVAMRLPFLAFFLAAAATFHLLARRLCGPAVAPWATVLYLAAPLSLYYSRAIHVDFFVLACGQGAFLLAMRGLSGPSPTALLAATALATAAALVKAPYLAVFAVPLLVWLRGRGLWRRALRFAPLALVPLAAFAWWRWHSAALAAAAPDWSFIPDYHRMPAGDGWYYGTLAQRLDGHNWLLLAKRFAGYVVGLGALPLFAAGLLRRREPGADTAAAWLGGALVVTVVFFNLNLVHDYYQLPLVAPAALVGGLGLAWLQHAFGARPGSRASGAWPVAAAAIAAIGCVAFAEARGYRVPPVPAAAGAVIAAHTPPGALVIAVWSRLDARSPYLLYPAHRDGWSIRESFLDRQLVESLRAEGATSLAWVREGPAWPRATAGVAGLPCREFPLATGTRLELCDLAP